MGMSFSRQNASESDSDSEIDLEDFLPYMNMVQEQREEYQVQVDAAITSQPQQPVQHLQLKLITHDQLSYIVDELDEYEKVSLVFLLEKDLSEAFELMLNLCKYKFKTFLQPFLRSQESTNKLIEALCVIQNYDLLKFLGYKKEVLKTEFFPTSDLSVVYIERIRKLLYRIAENFNKSQQEDFLKLIENDLFKNAPTQHFPKFDYLEIYFAYFFKRGYVNETNFDTIIKHLKVFDLELYAEFLKYWNSAHENLSHKRSLSPTSSNCENTHRLGESLHILNTDKTTENIDVSDEVAGPSGIGKKSVMSQNTAKAYKMDPDHPGICLIMENINFFEDLDDSPSVIKSDVVLAKREGSKYDSDRLRDIFNRFGYHVIYKRDQLHGQMLNAIRNAAHETATDADSSFIVIILSHGQLNQVIGTDCIPVNVDDIKQAINSKSLEGKPKILIYQACQGNTIMKIPNEPEEICTDGPTSTNTVDRSSRQPWQRHILELWSTVPGFASFRCPRKGTWLIESLCEVLEESSTESFLDICTLVNQRIFNRRSENKDSSVSVMVPKCEHTLDKKFYLPPLKKARN